MIVIDILIIIVYIIHIRIYGSKLQKIKSNNDLLKAKLNRAENRLRIEYPDRFCTFDGSVEGLYSDGQLVNIKKCDNKDEAEKLREILNK
jgi:hypothetical protein